MRGDALQDLDVIVLADQSPESILEGLSEPYPEKFRGGIGPKGIDHLKAFVEKGGTLLCLGQSGDLPLSQWQLESVGSGLKDASKVEIPGSLLKIRVNPRHPVGYGMAADAAAMFLDSSAFDIEAAVSIATYAEEDLLVSGWAEGQRQVQGRHAVVETPVGKGRLILIGFRTQFRAQTRATYKLLFNSLFYATVR